MDNAATEIDAIMASLKQAMAKARPRNIAEDRKTARCARWDLMSAYQVPKRLRRTVGQLRRYQDGKRIAPLRVVNRWVLYPDRLWCLVLSGSPGTGKSTAAAWWLWSKTKGRCPGGDIRRWWSAAEIASLSMYGEALAPVINVAALVIDDPGTEYSDKTGALKSVFDRVIDGRSREERPTLITTNLSRGDFAARYGQRVIDRIEDGGCFLEHTGTNLRRVKR